MELEFRHLSPYFPYGLNLQFIIRGVAERTGKMTNVTHDLELTYPTKIGLDYYDSEHIWMFKPILRPLSDFDSYPNDLDLTTDFESCYRISSGDIAFVNTSDKTYLSDIVTSSEFMFKNHFDVFGLTPAGLAISYEEAGLI